MGRTRIAQKGLQSPHVAHGSSCLQGGGRPRHLCRRSRPTLRRTPCETLPRLCRGVEVGGRWSVEAGQAKPDCQEAAPGVWWPSLQSLASVNVGRPHTFGFVQYCLLYALSTALRRALTYRVRRDSPEFADVLLAPVWVQLLAFVPNRLIRRSQQRGMYAGYFARARFAQVLFAQEHRVQVHHSQMLIGKYILLN